MDCTGTTTDYVADTNYKGNMAWLQQGVNVVDGTIYSVRGLTLGGCMNRSQSWYSTEGVNLGLMVDGYIDNDDPTGWFVGYFGQLRYGQILYNTDIVLLTPEGTNSVRNSYIKRPLNYRDVQSQSSSNDATNRNWRKTQSYYKPKEKIIGGQIYVGKNQNLTSEGGTQIIANPNGTYAAPGKTAPDDVFTGEYNMLVSPDAITVASGGILVIEASQNTNITTNIFVEGDLIIKPGAKISGDIYVYGGGKIDIQGIFSLDSPKGEKGGIFICGSTTEANGTLTGLGEVKNLNVNFLNNIAIQGTSGKIHFLDDAFTKNWLASGNSPGTWNTAAQRNRVLCTARDPMTNQCLHPGFTQGGVFEYIWEIEGYAND